MSEYTHDSLRMMSSWGYHALSKEFRAHLNAHADAWEADKVRIEVLERDQEELARYRAGASKLQDYIEELERLAALAQEKPEEADDGD